jgi:hypothetical protein
MKIQLPDWVKRAQRTRQDDERVERLERAVRKLGPQSRVTHAVRADGTKLTRPSTAARRAANRRRNHCARVARRHNRPKEN